MEKLRGMQFEDAGEVCMYTQNVVSSYTSDRFSDIYAKWLKRHGKCIQIYGDYIEKV